MEISMQYYLAPMEGVTGYLYRQGLHRFYGEKIDKYFAPFVSPTRDTILTPKERRDLAPAHNEDMYIVPQILTNQGDVFVETAKVLKEEFGYQEVNLNVGCPSGTVTAKAKGAGLLREPEMLEGLLDYIFTHSPLPVSVKTRIGFLEAAEFPAILELYSKYPMKELIVHPRVRKEFYKGKPDMDAFRQAYEKLTCPICYNGDIKTLEQIEVLSNTYPKVKAIMIGRGIIGNPGMLTETKTNYRKLKEFHDYLYQVYMQEMSGERNLLFKMKELWNYMEDVFPECHKEMKQIKKAQNCIAYKAAVNQVFSKQN
jgi:tRNA-dihydrouridine synthase